MTNPQLAAFLINNHGRIKVNQFDNGEYNLDILVCGKGGGVAGAWIGATLGTIAVSAVAYGTIGLVSSLTGPAASYIASALTAAFAFAIESTSIAVAASCGIALAVATGPV